jgi:hypothetical protein
MNSGVKPPTVDCNLMDRSVICLRPRFQSGFITSSGMPWAAQAVATIQPDGKSVRASSSIKFDLLRRSTATLNGLARSQLEVIGGGPAPSGASALSPQHSSKRTHWGGIGMALGCQKETHALHQTVSLFDQLVSTQQGRSAARAPTGRIRALLKSDGE